MTDQVYLLPKTIEVARVLDGSVLELYQDSIKSYNSEKARETLGKFEIVNGKLAGSSPFMNLQLAHLDSENPGLFPNRTRPSTREDLEKAIAKDNNFLRGFYTDFGLALRTQGDNYEPNDLLAKTLTEQLKHRGIELGNGILIPFSALAKPREHKDSTYGLVFDLNDSATKDSILDLAQFHWDYPGNQVLARACLYDAHDWDSDNRYLANSDSDGRVVGVGVEDASENLTLGHSEEKLKAAFEKAGVPANYELVMKHLTKPVII